MFGLAYWPDYHYYRGHVMWDIETFAVPPLLLTDPDAARALLDYRSTGSRPRAHNAQAGTATAAPSSRGRAARVRGRGGAGEGAAAAHEHHVSLDVA